jgi:hypothetical protein
MKIFFLFFTLFLVGCSSGSIVSVDQNMITFVMGSEHVNIRSLEILEIVHGIAIPEDIIISEGVDLYIYNRMSTSQRVDLSGISETIPSNSHVVMSPKKTGYLEVNGVPVATITIE